ncbi:MAG TPA: PQQ-binding-like beta-propeller repeat protein [Candidatus Dormibacteraeota bacterium]|nr:PQQ-binding-like beta-propeller repeat protein [Candidatus Dormibacteraeota bacterium]
MKPIATLVLAFVFANLAPAASASARAPKKPKDRTAKSATKGNWPDPDHGLRATRFSPLTQITAKDAPRLGKVCDYAFPEKQTSETSPVVWDGVLYATSAHDTVALDASTCKVKWLEKWTPRGPEPDHTDRNRGAVYADGKIVRGTPDDYLIAMDAKDGRIVWARQIADPRKGYFISMVPLVHGGLIYVGPAGAEWASSGWVGAYKLSDGSPVWKFHIVPQGGEPGAETWGPDPAARTHGGGNLWTELTFDTKRDLLYVPGGNAAPDLYSVGRPGANLYTNSIMALDGQTGRLVWYHQFIPHDTHDYDQTHAGPLFETKIDGELRSVVATTGKNGILSVLDRHTRKLIYSVPFATQLNNQAELTTTPVHVCPGPLGGQLWSGSGFNPQLNLIVVQSVEWCATMAAATAKPSAEHAEAYGEYWGGMHKVDPWPEAHGRVTAFDASTGKMVWRHPTPQPMVGGLTLTASNLVFTGELNGDFDVMDARTGKMLYQYPLHNAVQGGVITYLAGGSQYVAVVSGGGGVYGRIRPNIGDVTTLSVFGLRNRGQ